MQGRVPCAVSAPLEQVFSALFDNAFHVGGEIIEKVVRTGVEYHFQCQQRGKGRQLPSLFPSVHGADMPAAEQKRDVPLRETRPLAIRAHVIAACGLLS